MTNAYVGVCGRRLVVVVLAMSCYMCSSTQVGMAMVYSWSHSVDRVRLLVMKLFGPLVNLFGQLPASLSN